MTPKTVGLVGSRGYVGRELVALLERHSGFDLRLAVSQRDGLAPDDIAGHRLDAYVLALPNGATPAFVAAIDRLHPAAVIVDLSADHRFDRAWIYGQPERNRAAIRGASRIANPGCYATALQLAAAPLVGRATGPVNAFGVSGYSGAGTTPSPKNDPDALRDNLMPYALVGHVHEREVEGQLGCRVFFVPHVAPFFRGISVTVSFDLATATTREELSAIYEAAYASEPLVVFQHDIPHVRDIAGHHHVVLGGLAVADDGRHAVIVATIDNLLGGAATQAVRNLNLAFGFDERAPDLARG